MITENQKAVLNKAFEIAGSYYGVMNPVLAALPSVNPQVDSAVVAMAYKMKDLNAGRPDAEMIIQEILTVTWEELGVQGVPALQQSEREGIIGVIMSVAKSIITQQANELMSVAGLDTSFPAEA